MSKMMQQDDEFNSTLFDARNYYYIGNYMSSINTVLPHQRNSSPDLLSYMYLSYLAIDSGRLIPSEIKENDQTPLAALRHLYTFLNYPEKKEEKLHLFSDKVASDSGETNIWLITAAIAYCHDGDYGNSLKVLHGSTDLECQALSIYCLLKLNRVDLAEPILKKMQDKSDDATLTQLAQAWIGIANGGKGLQEAFHIFQEFCEKYQSTPLLLNGQAVCHLGQGNFSEAEGVLRESLSKKHNDYDTLVNLIVLSHLTGKGSDTINRYLEQLRQFFPKSEFVVDYDRNEKEFDNLCQNYQFKRAEHILH